MNVGLALLSALLLILTFPRTDWNWLAPLALTPLLVALWREPRARYRFLLGYGAGIVYWFGICYWIQFVLAFHGGMGEAGGWGTFLLFCLAKAAHLGGFSLLAASVLSRWYALPAVAALWTGIERTHAPLGFAWLALGNAGIDMVVPMRLAPFVGVYGLSFVFAMLNTAISFLVLRRPRKHLLWVAPLPLLILLPSLPPALPGARQSVVVQPNIEQHEQWTESTAEELKRKLVSMSLRSARQSDEPPPEILLWPEVPAPLYYYEDSRLREQINQLSALSGVPILFGTVAHTPQRSPLNSALKVAPNGEAVDRYDKIKLVPFGEFVPPLFGFVTRITQEAGDFVPGNRVVTFPVSGRKVGAFICYESVFPHLVRQFTRSGGELLVNLSNDGYFGKTAAREQHLKIVRMRAAENRRWIIRATNDGITAGIDPAGRLAQVLEPYQTAATRMRFSWEAGITPYAHYGDWFAWGCLLGGLGAVLATQVPRYIPEERRRALNRDESRARRRP